MGLREPQLGLRRAVHEMGLRSEPDSLAAQRRIYGANVGDLKVNSGSPLSPLIRRQYPKKKRNPAAIEECHLRRSGEQERHTEDVPIKRHTFLEILDGNQQL